MTLDGIVEHVFRIPSANHASSTRAEYRPLAGAPSTDA
jgi:hypothetical protein